MLHFMTPPLWLEVGHGHIQEELFTEFKMIVLLITQLLRLVGRVAVRKLVDHNYWLDSFK